MSDDQYVDLGQGRRRRKDEFDPSFLLFFAIIVILLGAGVWGFFRFFTDPVSKGYCEQKYPHYICALRPLTQP